MMESQWLLSLGGGMLAGLSALILMLFNGRVAGISGILAGEQHQDQGRESHQHAAAQREHPLAFHHRDSLISE